MGLLDGLLGNVLGGMMGGGNSGMQHGMPGMPDVQGTQGGGAQAALIQMVLQMLQRNGGVGGLLQQFQQAGYARQADSWVSTGQNLPIDAGALQQILGGGQLGQLAQQFGMSTDDAAGGLADVLPQVIDRMTPQGAVPDNSNDLVQQALALLQKGR
jgi:uncharacterized protein YidB (DUF937 family)